VAWASAEFDSSANAPKVNTTEKKKPADGFRRSFDGILNLSRTLDTRAERWPVYQRRLRYDAESTSSANTLMLQGANAVDLNCYRQANNERNR
jgi:hypothetical protein